MEEHRDEPSLREPIPEIDVKKHPEGGYHGEDVIVTSNSGVISAEAYQTQELCDKSFDLGNEEYVGNADLSRDSISHPPSTSPPSSSTEESGCSEWWTDTPSCPVRIQYGDSGAAAEPTETVIEMFERIKAAYGEHPALAVKRHGEWKEWTYHKYYDDCVIAAKALIELGLKPHHSVCILGFNAPEWSITNLATIMAGGLSTGLYLTSSPEACLSIACDSKANVIVVENDSQLQKILQVRDKLPHLKAIVQYTRDVTERDDNVWDSGTTGQPKGVMLSHDNLTWMCRQVMREASCNIGQERFVSYLPLSHVASQLLDIYTSLASAGTCWFAQPDALKGSLVQTMKEVQPTMFLGVPRVYEKIAESMQMVARNTTGLKARISSWAKGVGLKGNYAKQTGSSATPFGWTFANWVFFKKVRQALGLAECHFPISGAAPMSQETLLYFMSINIPIHEIYGMSETTGPTTVTTADRIRFKSSGRPFDGVDIKIDSPDDSGAGEVLVRGRHVFMGYIGLAEKTREVLDRQGWFKSGDVGYIDKEGYLYITGRRKELIITAGGEKIAPVPIENSIKHELPIVSQAMVIGDQQKYLSCLLTLKVETDHKTGLPEDQLTEVAVAECSKVGSSALTVSDILCNGGDSRVLRMIQRGIDSVNRRALSRAQKIAKWSILERDFSIASGELTPTMKLKRRDIMLKYADSIESFYND